MTTDVLPRPGSAPPRRRRPLARPAQPALDRPPRGRVGRFVRGRPDDPRWVRPALLSLLASTALLYLWDLGASGWSNTYYSAAVQAGSQSWKAFFFGSLDSASSITVDKAPAFLWPMEISARIFGVNTWSILVPEALMGVATVALVYAAVRRWFTPGAGLIAGAVVALTPVATLMFRFNNPDALLVLLLTAAAYATIRALEKAETKWVVAVGALIGFAFLAKMFQAFLVVPGLRPRLPRGRPDPAAATQRSSSSRHWSRWSPPAGGGWPSSRSGPRRSRPYIGGSQNNSLLNLIFGYNGFGRLSGNETGSVGGGGGANGTGMWGATGLTRLFNSSFGAQASWLLPAALLLLATVLVLTITTGRTARTRAAMIVWGGWLVVTGLAFSLGQGIIHQYYTVALVPPIGAIIGIGVTTLWARRDQLAPRLALAGTLGATAAWSAQLLHRTSAWHPELHMIVLVAGLGAAAALVCLPLLPSSRGLWIGVARSPSPRACSAPAPTRSPRHPSPTPGPSRPPVLPAPARVVREAAGAAASAAAGHRQCRAGGGTTARRDARGGAGGSAGSSTAARRAPALTATLKANASSYTWVAAVVSANQAAGYQLATGEPVMAIGGFNGTDPSPTLAQFQADVAAGHIHYFIAGGGAGGPGGQASNGTSSAIAQWVAANFSAQTVGNATLYDLTG